MVTYGHAITLRGNHLHSGSPAGHLVVHDGPYTHDSPRINWSAIADTCPLRPSHSREAASWYSSSVFTSPQPQQIRYSASQLGAKTHLCLWTSQWSMTASCKASRLGTPGWQPRNMARRERLVGSAWRMSASDIVHAIRTTHEYTPTGCCQNT